MKYIRTKDGRLVNRSDFQGFKSHGTTGRYLVRTLEDDNDLELWLKYSRTSVIKQADTIEELCDFAYALWDDNTFEVYDLSYDTVTLKELCSYLLGSEVKEVYYGIKTDKGLIYVAKMNEKGELELL